MRWKRGHQSSWLAWFRTLYQPVSFTKWEDLKLIYLPFFFFFNVSSSFHLWDSHFYLETFGLQSFCLLFSLILQRVGDIFTMLTRNTFHSFTSLSLYVFVCRSMWSWFLTDRQTDKTVNGNDCDASLSVTRIHPVVMLQADRKSLLLWASVTHTHTYTHTWCNVMFKVFVVSFVWMNTWNIFSWP